MFFIDTEHLADWVKTGRSILDRDGTERKAAE
jgi:hypothetical protein